MIKNYATNNEALLKRVADGDETARHELILHNMGLVHSVVKRFTGRGFETEDLFQIGCVGLTLAAERFDPSFGVQFSTYAVPMIIGEIKRFIRDDGIIKVSRSLKELAARAVKANEQILKKTGKEPTVTELANMLGVSACSLATALEARRPTQSIYSCTEESDGEGRSLIEKLESKSDDIGNMLNRVMLEKAISDFSEREQQLVYYRYFKQKTQAQVAERLGISQVQVSRLEKKILLKLREKISKE